MAARFAPTISEPAARFAQSSSIAPECAPAPLRTACARSRRKTHGIGSNRPGQSSSLCGQAIQVASCGSHSAGMRKPSARGVRRSPCRQRSHEKPVHNRPVRVDAPVAQKRPVAPDFFHLLPDRIPRSESLPYRAMLRPARGRTGSLTNEAPQNSALYPAAFEAHAIHGRHIDAVRDGVRALAVRQASCCASPYCAFSAGCQPMAVG
jgi:hypothetical protein